MAADKVAGTLRVPSAAAKKAYPPHLWIFLVLAAGIFSISSNAVAQIGDMPLSDLSEVVQVDEADHAAVVLLEVAKAQIAQRQWAEALEKLRQAQESAGRKLFKLDDRRFIPLREYCQLLMASLPAEALSAYRDRIDPLAKSLYEDAIGCHGQAQSARVDASGLDGSDSSRASHGQTALARGTPSRLARSTPSCDSEFLEKVVDRYFVSSYGDDALFALGEIALERGEYRKARWHWERIGREFRSADGLPLWLASPKAASDKKPSPWLAYPDTELNRADIFARLVLVSILEGDLPRAKFEHQLLSKHHPGAKGKLGGREVVYAEALAEMIDSAKSWPNQTELDRDWPTFAGSQSRQHIAPDTLSLQNRIAEILLSTQFRPATSSPSPSVPFPREAPQPEPRPGKELAPSLAYHPVVAGGLLLVNNRDEVFAYDASSGKPAWQGDAKKPGRIFFGGEGDSSVGQNIHHGAPFIGMPQFTLTVSGRWLLARMGSPITGRTVEPPRVFDSSYVVCLDLEAEGRLHWKLMPDDARWAFEGSPVCDGTNVYIAMRHSDSAGTPQQHVACFDLQTGARRWRQMVCAAQSSAPGSVSDAINNLLTLVDDTLYLNTNLGAVVALDTADGRIRWLATYPRVWRKALVDCEPNPAVYWQGILFVTPADFAGVMALDASTGQMLWHSDVPRGATHLLGVSGGKLWAAGNSLWALDARSGQMEFHSDAPAHGRGLLAGDKVYRPARIVRPGEIAAQAGYEIRVVDAQMAKELSPIRLDTLVPPCESGNLAMTDEQLVIAGTDRISLFALPPPGASNTKPSGQATSNRVEP